MYTYTTLIPNPAFEPDSPEGVPEELEIETDFEITSWGSPPHMGSLEYPGDPGDPPEWEISEIRVEGEKIHLPKKEEDPEGYDRWQKLAEILDTEIGENFDFGDACSARDDYDYDHDY